MSTTDTSTTQIRLAGFDELTSREAYHLWRLRQEVFIIEQECPYPDLDGRDLESGTRHVLLTIGGELVGCARVLSDGTGGVDRRIGRVLLAQRARGRGLADVLMRAALAECGQAAIHLDAQSGLADWYGSFGFAVTGPEYLEDGVPHLPMSRPAASA